MPFYNSPKSPVQLLQKGVPAYLFGGLNLLRGNSSGTVADVALATNVGTVTVQINQGQIPLVGDTITVWGTTSASGLFNVVRAVITAVSINTGTNAGTISFALTGSNLSITADTGMFLIEVGETSDTLAAGNSIPVLVQSPQCDSQFTLPYAVTFPTLPTAVTVNLQAAMRDVNAEYVTVQAGIAVVAAGAQTVGPFGQITLQRGYLYRFNVSGLTGTGLITAKIGG